MILPLAIPKEVRLSWRVWEALMVATWTPADRSGVDNGMLRLCRDMWDRL